MKVVISSGHGKHIRGASGYIDEVDEARKVVETTADYLREAGVEVTTYHDNVSDDQSENLKRIVDFHNAQTRDLDVSVHFNAYQTTQKPMGCEVLYVSQTGQEIADVVVDQICEASGLINRGPKKRTDLAFLNNTEEPAILVETCFVDSQADVDIYYQNYDVICGAIAGAIAGEDSGHPIPPTPEPPDDVLFAAEGTCSTFGGPDDTGVSPSEGLAFIYNYDEAPYLFLGFQPNGTTGLARRLDPTTFYVACRWNYDDTPKEMLRDSGQLALITNKQTGVCRLAHPADWGPHEAETGRAADLSPGLAESLGVETDDVVSVLYPFRP
jgi:N-acetylmuramoyl-L-alanine amidase